MLDKVASTLTVPPTMHLDQLIELDSPESLLPRLSETTELMVLGHDHPALGGHMPFGHTTSTVASMSRHPVVAVPRGWTARADDRRPVAVAVDGQHPSSSTLGYAFTEASLGQAPVLVVHSAPLADLASGEQDSRLNLAEILAGWKADYPDVDVDTLLLAGSPRDTVPSVSADAQLLVVGSPYRGREWTRWIRSVARAVLDRATCPVAVVPQQRLPQRPRIRAAGCNDWMQPKGGNAQRVVPSAMSNVPLPRLLRVGSMSSSTLIGKSRTSSVQRRSESRCVMLRGAVRRPQQRLADLSTAMPAARTARFTETVRRTR